MSGFDGDAIILSGKTGTKLKSEILKKYYPFWWKITSGGQSINNRIPTTIIEMNAATSEIKIKETGEVILGSAGHALKLKMNESNAWNLKVILIEENDDCFTRLKNVIARRWPFFTSKIKDAEGPIESNYTKIYLMNKKLDDALSLIENIDIELGISMFFFDPLLYVDWAKIERVAEKRITSFLKPGTEFIIFLFTSDWFLGRDSPFEIAPLPNSLVKDDWTSSQRETVHKVDNLFGNEDWRNTLLTDKPIAERQQELVTLYRKRLLKWFRYILPLPFAPKKTNIPSIYLLKF